MATTTSVQPRVDELTTQADAPHTGEKSAIVKLEEVKETPELLSPPVGGRSATGEPNHLNQLNPQNARRQSLPLDFSQKEYKEKTRRRTSFISDLGSAAARRRSYNGLVPPTQQPPK
jgi:hypothetical protein